MQLSHLIAMNKISLVARCFSIRFSMHQSIWIWYFVCLGQYVMHICMKYKIFEVVWNTKKLLIYIVYVHRTHALFAHNLFLLLFVQHKRFSDWRRFLWCVFAQILFVVIWFLIWVFLWVRPFFTLNFIFVFVLRVFCCVCAVYFCVIQNAADFKLVWIK